MTFRDRVKKIRGIEVKYRNGGGQVVEYYEESDTCLVRLRAGTVYFANPDRSMSLELISDGHDYIVITLDELEIFNRI